MTLHGGARTFLGPFVGASTYLVLGDWLASSPSGWPLMSESYDCPSDGQDRSLLTHYVPSIEPVPPA
jgi:hypothetical protein